MRKIIKSDYLWVVYLRPKSYLGVLFSIPGVPIENKTIKGGGLLVFGFHRNVFGLDFFQKIVQFFLIYIDYFYFGYIALSI